MELVRLTPDNISDIEDVDICLLSFDTGYLDDMTCELGENITDRICGYISFSDDRRDRMWRDRIIPEISVRDDEASNIRMRLYSRTGKRCVYVITDDYYREIYDRFGSDHPDIDKICFYANQETSYDLEYRNMYSDTPLRNMILFRSGPHASAYIRGTDFYDNARALFEYMLSAGMDEEYELVWLVKDPADYSERYADHPNVRFISFDWAVAQDEGLRGEYYEVLCLAKYIFFTDAYGFCRNARADQTRIQLWHGCGFKTRVNFVSCERRYEYMPVISDMYADIHKKIYGLREDQIFVTGYPKDDWLFHPRDGWKEVLNIPAAAKYIFWLPTFRKTDVAKLSEVDMYVLENETGLPLVRNLDELGMIDRLLKAADMILVIKLHPFQDASLINIGERTNIVLLDNNDLIDNDIQINELLGHADALVSDYSSAAVDFQILDRSTAFSIDDIDEYENGRGFVYEPLRDWLPGKELYETSDLIDFLDEISKGIDSTADKRRRIASQMHAFRDDQSCKRLVERLISFQGLR